MPADGTTLGFAFHDFRTAMAQTHMITWLNDGVDGAVAEADKAGLVVAGLGLEDALADAVHVHEVVGEPVQHDVWSRSPTFVDHRGSERFLVDLEEVEDLLEAAGQFGARLHDQHDRDHVVEGPGQLFEGVVAEVERALARLDLALARWERKLAAVLRSSRVDAHDRLGLPVVVDLRSEVDHQVDRHLRLDRHQKAEHVRQVLVRL